MFTIAIDIIKDQDPQSIDECRLRYYWFKWKEAIEIELTSLAKINVFAPRGCSVCSVQISICTKT